MTGCPRCGQQTSEMSEMEATAPGWVVAQCRCGFSREITTSDALALRRVEVVKAATMPAAPPVGPPRRPAEQGEVARLRWLACDMWRRGAIDDDAYQRALARLGAAEAPVSG